MSDTIDQTELLTLSPTNERALNLLLANLPDEYRAIANGLIRQAIRNGMYADRWILERHGDNEFLVRAFEGDKLEFFVIPRKGHRLFMYVA